MFDISARVPCPCGKYPVTMDAKADGLSNRVRQPIESNRAFPHGSPELQAWAAAQEEARRVARAGAVALQLPGAAA